MDNVAVVFGVLCLAPGVLFFGGFALGRWSKGIRLTRIDPADMRYARASQGDQVGQSQPAPQGGQIKRIGGR